MEHFKDGGFRTPLPTASRFQQSVETVKQQRGTKATRERAGASKRWKTAETSTVGWKATNFKLHSTGISR